MDPRDLLRKELAGASPAMARLRQRIERVAPTSAPVLLTGETGTGKTSVARMIHALSERGQAPLVKVNCPGIPDTLFESELFGHEKGAFTGAVSRRVGLMEEAHGGSLLLDEVGDLSPGGQAKLLAALDEGEVRPVGGRRAVPVDLRLLSATSRDLDGAVESGEFRADLFHRVAVVRLHVPALRERPGDLEPLARNHLRRLSRRYRRPLPRITPCGWAFLRDRGWPGNVRELAHLLEAALVLAGEAEALDRTALLEAVPERVSSGSGVGR
jgi:DNA-binding NtrC family response regulator